MEISRRDFLRFSVAAGSATALGGLIGSGVNLGPVVARAQELRIKGAKVTPSVCPFCSVGCGTLSGGIAEPSYLFGDLPNRRSYHPGAVGKNTDGQSLITEIVNTDFTSLLIIF